jgi:hypothetical protein
MAADNNARLRTLADPVDALQAAASAHLLTKLAPLLPADAWRGTGPGGSARG